MPSHDLACSITFSNPVDVILYVGFIASMSDGGSNIFNVAMANESTTYQVNHGFAYYQAYTSYGQRSADNKTYTWYNTNAYAGYQLNILNVKYYFLGLSGVKSLT